MDKPVNKQNERPRHARPPKPPRPRLFGRHPLTLGALALLGLSGYELWIRLDDFWAWTAGVRHLSAVHGTSFLKDMAIIFEEPRMQRLAFQMGFLIAAVVFAAVSIIRRRRAGGWWVMAALALALGAAGYSLSLYGFGGWIQLIKLAPLGMIAVGFTGNGAQGYVLKRREKRKKLSPPE